MLRSKFLIGVLIASVIQAACLNSTVHAQAMGKDSSSQPIVFDDSRLDTGLEAVEGVILEAKPSQEVIVRLDSNSGVRIRDLLQVDRGGRDLGVIEVLEVTDTQVKCVSDKALAPGDHVKLVHQISVAGICKDKAGQPIEDATVALFRHSENYFDSPKLITQQTSGTGGEFSFVEISARRTVYRETDLLLVVAKSGYASLTSSVPLEADNQQLVLSDQTGMLVGIVLDDQGEPLQGATVHTAGRNRNIAGIHSAVTDANGKFRISDLSIWKPDPEANSRRFLTVAHPRFAPTRAHYSSIPDVVNIKVGAPAIIQGTVVDQVKQTPAAGVLISAQGCTESGWFQTRSDSSGSFLLRVTADKYNVWAEMNDRIAIAAESVEAIPGAIQTDVKIEMVKGGVVFGQLLDAKGKPILPQGRTSVAHYGPARPRSGAAVTSTLVRPDGSFRLRVAPGSNYIYVMSGGSSANVTIEDGQELEVNLVSGKAAAAPMRAMRAIRLRPARRVNEPEAKPAPRDNTPVGLLLDKLEKQNQDGTRFSDEWLLTMKQIVDLDEAAVPELCKELDSTQDDMMLRCLGFLLRAIGSPKAVPALIRSIPKTLRPPGSDMGLRVTDKSLEQFAYKHDLDENNGEGRYGFGRPVREILGALQRITSKKSQDSQLYHSFLVGTDFQKALKRKMFVRQAVKWQTWWEANAKDFKVPPEYLTVNLPPFNDTVPMAELPPQARYSLDQLSSNWLLESFIDPKARTVFLDIDTGRIAALPNKWRKQLHETVPMDEIDAWASHEGFDLMGTQVTLNADQGTCYALRSIGLRAWELPEERWKQRPKDIMLEELIQEGKEAGEFLLASTPSGVNYLGTASFFVLTREGTPAMLFVGVSVHRDDQKPGGIAGRADDELNESAFNKGRRFAFGLFQMNSDE